MTDPAWRLLFTVGFLGSYTTFSAYAYETIALIDRGDLALAAGNILASNLLSLGAVLLGIALARWT